MSKMFIIGIGPGNNDCLTLQAKMAIEQSDIIIGYKSYLDQVRELTHNKKIISFHMKQEVDRCKKALELVEEGSTVSVISLELFLSMVR